MYNRSVVSRVPTRRLLLVAAALLSSTGLIAGCADVVDGGGTIDSDSDSGPSPTDSGTPDAGTDAGTDASTDASTESGEGTCEPESDAELCTSLAKKCGTVSATDQCGEARDLECGSCSGDETCGGGGEDNVCGVATDCVPSSNVPSGWSYLDNGIARIGVDLSFGGAIGHFSVNDYNVLNSSDSGRYLQQSFYGADIGGSWHDMPWAFNPVQGGSSENDPSEVTEFCNNGTHLYAKTIPLDWGGTGVTPTVMEEWITLDGDMAIIRFRFEYQGDWDNPEKHQEVPALFVQRELEHLNYYEGNAPWTGGELQDKLPYDLEMQGNEYINFTESWLAYVNADNWGIGLYKRDEDFATCYRYSTIGNNAATSYFAFIDAFALTPGVVHDYVLYAKIGDLTDIRAKFYELHQQGL